MIVEVSYVVEVDNDLPDGIMIGYGYDGNLLVCVECVPRILFLYGTAADEENVVRWTTARSHERRLNIMIAWKLMNFVCQGEA